MKETVLVLTAHYSAAENFEKYIDSFFLRARSAEARGRMLAAVEELISPSYSSKLNKDAKDKLGSLATCMKALVPFSAAEANSSLDDAPPKKRKKNKSLSSSFI